MPAIRSLAAIIVGTLLVIQGHVLHAQDRLPPYFNAYQQGPPPVSPWLEYEASDFAPRAKGLSRSSTTVQATERPRALSEQEIEKLWMGLKENKAVKDALGQRFVQLEGELIEPAKGREITTPSLVQFTVYSYTNNRAYEISTQGGASPQIILKPKGYQPAESNSEIENAVAILKRNSAVLVDGLIPRGIVTPVDSGDRHLYLQFYRNRGIDRGPPIVEATVDMTNDKVVSVRTRQ